MSHDSYNFAVARLTKKKKVSLNKKETWKAARWKSKRLKRPFFRTMEDCCVRLSKFEHSYQQVADSVKPDLLTASDSQRKVRLKIHLLTAVWLVNKENWLLNYYPTPLWLVCLFAVFPFLAFLLRRGVAYNLLKYTLHLSGKIKSIE